MDTIPQHHFLENLVANVDNNKLSDEEFREYIRNTLSGVEGIDYSKDIVSLKEIIDLTINEFISMINDGTDFDELIAFVKINAAGDGKIAVAAKRAIQEVSSPKNKREIDSILQHAQSDLKNRLVRVLTNYISGD